MKIYQNLTKEKRLLMFQNLFKSGMSVAEISQKSGWSKETVRLAVKDLPEYKADKPKTIQAQTDSSASKSSLGKVEIAKSDMLKALQDFTEQNPSSAKTENIKPQQLKEDIAESLSEPNDEEIKDVKWVANNSMVNIVINGEVYNADSSHESFDDIIKALLNKDYNKIKGLLNTGKTIENWSKGQFEYKNGQLYYYGETIHGVLIDKIINSIKNGQEDVDNYVNFLELAIQNDRSSYDEMFSFLKHNDIQINEHGFIVGYKKVTRKNNGLFDSHTRTIPNDVGTVVKMPRHLVNPDKNITCSWGLHVGSIDYVENFSGDVIIKVLLDPRDVVSVPTDYNGQKLRCAEYFVHQVLDDQMNVIEQTSIVERTVICNRSGFVSELDDNYQY